MSYTRREFSQLALAALPWPALTAAQQKPNSKWAGVQVGMNVPYNFGMGNYLAGDEILRRCTALNVSGVELRMQPVELFMGSPDAVAAAERDRAQRAARASGAPGGAGRGRASLTPEEQAAQKAAADALRTWRLAAPMGKVREFKKMYDDAGVAIEIVKVDGIFGFTDDILDYAFTLAKTLGARAISTEISTAADRVAQFKRLGEFGARHKMMLGFHGHTATGPTQWEEAFTAGQYNGANLDIGHFVGGHKTSPVPFLKQHHDRITHIHVKDKTLDDRNVPFGEGDTPVREVLQTIRDNNWNIQATIEFEYPVPPGSDRTAELTKCVEYCKRCLLG